VEETLEATVDEATRDALEEVLEQDTDDETRP
jgi:hypothetical protein